MSIFLKYLLFLWGSKYVEDFYDEKEMLVFLKQRL